MIIKLNSDFKIKISDQSLKIRKGIWNFLDIEINQSDYTPKKFQEIIKYFKTLIQNKQLNLPEKNYPKLFDDLLMYNVVYKEEQNLVPIDLIVSSQPEKIKIYSEITKINFNQLDQKMLTKYHNIMLIFSNYDFKQMQEINHQMRKENKNHSFIILDGDFIHLIAFNDPKKACFECFHHRITSRLNNYHDLENIDEYDSDIGEHHTNEIYLLLSLYKIVENNFKKYTYNPLNGKVFSLYKPTLELQFDKILKISLCQECGASSRTESFELNINLANAINKIL